MESRPTTCRHLTFHLFSTRQLSSFIRLWHQEVLHVATLQHYIETVNDNIGGWGYLSLRCLMISRKGVCALCCGRESLSCVGPSLPDDSPPPHSSVLCALCATEALDFPKQRLSATAYSPGPKTAGERVEWAQIKQSKEQTYIINPQKLSWLSWQELMSSFTACKTSSICTIYCMFTLNTVSSPPLLCPLLVWPQRSQRKSLSPHPHPHQWIFGISEQSNQCNGNIK